MKTQLLSLSYLLFTALPATADEKPNIVVELALRSETGVVHCNLWKSPDGFPQEYKKAAVRVDAPVIKDKKAQCTFPAVEAGVYAISIFHDEDGDGELKTGLFGIPKEPLGFSNNAKGSMGPPKYDDAKFKYDGKALVVQISPK